FKSASRGAFANAMYFSAWRMERRQCSLSHFLHSPCSTIALALANFSPAARLQSSFSLRTARAALFAASIASRSARIPARNASSSASPDWSGRATASLSWQTRRDCCPFEVAADLAFFVRPVVSAAGFFGLVFGVVSFVDCGAISDFGLPGIVVLPYTGAQ